MSSRKPVPESTIPEVAVFVEAQERLERFKAAYPDLFEQLDHLVEEHNTALEAADKAVRGQQVSCGPFVMMSSTTKYDADKLFEELGRDKFLEVGGQVKTVTVYDIDKARLEAHLASGIIKPDVVATFRTITPRYKKPEKIVL